MPGQVGPTAALGLKPWGPLLAGPSRDDVGGDRRPARPGREGGGLSAPGQLGRGELPLATRQSLECPVWPEHAGCTPCLLTFLGHPCQLLHPSPMVRLELGLPEKPMEWSLNVSPDQGSLRVKLGLGLLSPF